MQKSWKRHTIYCYQLDFSDFPCQEGDTSGLPDWRHAGRWAGINQMRTLCVTARESKSGSVSRCHCAERYVIVCLLWQAGTVRPAACRKESYKEHCSPELKTNILLWHAAMSDPYSQSAWRQKQRQDNSLYTLYILQKCRVKKDAWRVTQDPRAEPHISLTLSTVNNP